MLFSHTTPEPLPFQGKKEGIFMQMPDALALHFRGDNTWRHSKSDVGHCRALCGSFGRQSQRLGATARVILRVAVTEVVLLKCKCGLPIHHVVPRRSDCRTQILSSKVCRLKFVLESLCCKNFWTELVGARGSTSLTVRTCRGEEQEQLAHDLQEGRRLPAEPV